MRLFVAVLIGIFMLTATASAKEIVKCKCAVVKGQVTTKDGYGVWTKDGYPVMIKNVKAAKK